MQNEQMALPGFPKVAGTPVKKGPRAALEKQIKDLDERVFNLEFELVTLKGRLDSWEENDDE